MTDRELLEVGKTYAVPFPFVLEDVDLPQDDPEATEPFATIKHQAVPPKDGRSLDGWWFDCDVLWDDTGKVSRSPVESFKLCAEDGGRNADIQALDAAMMDYLKTNARHCDDRTKHEGWYFTERRAKVAA